MQPNVSSTARGRTRRKLSPERRLRRVDDGEIGRIRVPGDEQPAGGVRGDAVGVVTSEAAKKVENASEALPLVDGSKHETKTSVAPARSSAARPG
jgi:hypothetical protein